MTPITVSTGENPAEEAAIRAVLAEANAARGWPHAPAPLRVPLHDDAGAVIGGLVGLRNWGWLWIQAVAVPPALRGRGLGARLLAVAEAEARATCCIGARLDTYSFQARGFYERQGYAVTGAIEDCPPGQTRFSMAKRLDASPESDSWPDGETPRATISLTRSEREPGIEAILEGLIAHNAPFTGEHGYAPFNLIVRRPGETAPCGGLIAFVLYRWLFVRLFYLPDDLRRGGLGTALLSRAETEARARGCAGIWLDTFSFQARPFYERMGFRSFGRLDDFPPGHSRHFLMKRLDGAGDTACST